MADANKEAVVSALSRLTSRRTLRLVRATYTNLVSTGNLRLIRTPPCATASSSITMPVAAGSDPLWRLSARAPEYEVLVGKVWQRTSVSFQAIINVKVIVEQSAGSRAAIAAELAGRRWPD